MADMEAGTRDTTSPIPSTIVELGRRHSYYANKGGERFNLVALHRMNIHYLRKRLLSEAATIFKNGEMEDDNSKTLTSLMQDYSTAIRDREYMREWALRDWYNNPFLLRSQRKMERDLIDDLKAKGIHPEQMLLFEDDHTLPHLPGGPWDSPFALKTKRERYALAVLGGVILVAPVILMVLVQTTLASLVTVAICTLIFAVTASYFSPTKLPLELLSVTAAYAAVLVVFVGGTTGPAA